MSSEVKVSVGSGNTIENLVNSLFTGGPSDAVIAVLLLVIILLGLLSWKLNKNSEENKKRADELIVESNKQMLELSARYSDSIEEIQEKHNHEIRMLGTSLEATKLILTEVKVLLSVVVKQPMKKSE